MIHLLSFRSAIWWVGKPGLHLFFRSLEQVVSFRVYDPIVFLHLLLLESFYISYFWVIIKFKEYWIFSLGLGLKTCFSIFIVIQLSYFFGRYRVFIPNFFNAVHWCYNNRWVQEAHWKRPSVGKKIPASKSAWTNCWWDHTDSKRSSREIWDSPQAPLHRWSPSCCCKIIVPVHQVCDVISLHSCPIFTSISTAPTVSVLLCE